MGAEVTFENDNDNDKKKLKIGKIKKKWERGRRNPHKMHKGRNTKDNKINQLYVKKGIHVLKMFFNFR